MGKALELQELKRALQDTRQHIAIAKIVSMSVDTERRFLKCAVAIFPENREIISRMSWDLCHGFSFPAVNDIVLVAFADGEIDDCFVIKRLTSKDDKIPVQAMSGDSAFVSRSGKKAWLSSDTRVNISKGSATPNENLVLGQQLKTLLSDLIQIMSDLASDVATHTHAGNLGYPTSPPNQAAAFTALSGDLDDLKSSPVDDSLILSDFAFTEKG